MTASPSQGFERESERRIKRDIHVFYTILRCVIHPTEPTQLLVVILPTPCVRGTGFWLQQVPCPSSHISRSRKAPEDEW